MSEKRKLSDYLDALIDDDGIKTDLSVTISKNDLERIAIVLIASGVAITLVWHLVKNIFHNRQLSTTNRQLLEIKNHLKS